MSRISISKKTVKSFSGGFFGVLFFYCAGRKIRKVFVWFEKIAEIAAFLVKNWFIYGFVAIVM